MTDREIMTALLAGNIIADRYDIAVRLEGDTLMSKAIGHDKEWIEAKSFFQMEYLTSSRGGERSSPYDFRVFNGEVP